MENNNNENNPSIMRRLFKNPIVLITLGVVFLVPALYSLIYEFTLTAVLFYIPVVMLGAGLLLGGVMRLFTKKK